MVNLQTPPTEATPAKTGLSLIYRDAHQTLPQRVFQPLNIAILTSAVLHGVVGYGAPALPFFQQPTIPKEVRIMELTPQEQSRIRRDAQPLTPTVTGVPIPNAPSLGSTANPGFPGTFPNNNLGSTPNNNFNNSPRVSGFPSFNPGNNYSYAPANPSQSGGFGDSRTNQRQEQRIDQGSGQRQTAITPREPVAPNTPVRRSDQFITANNFSTGNQSAFNRPFVPTPPGGVNSSPTPTPTAIASPTPSPSNNGSNGNVAIAPTPNSNNGSTSGDNGTGTPGNGTTGQPNGTPQISPQLAFNPANADPTPEILASNFAGFLGAGNEALLSRDKQEELTLSNVAYPPAACGLKLEGTTIKTVLGLITDGGGAITKGPAVLKSSGYEIFNQAAIAAANAYTPFSPTKVYVITVPFTYSPEACPNSSNSNNAPSTNLGTVPATPGETTSPTPVN